ncbi:hypothetical protein FHS99_000762 [Sphingomonas prati]|uniref:Uncharacterized protein n=1 Tax=Sphingomonas prati TaxID=1843237 RepID=A0A7W9BQL0_9SPHN|nr:hypothetical protein [Sphingomonas prati]
MIADYTDRLIWKLVYGVFQSAIDQLNVGDCA